MSYLNWSLFAREYRHTTHIAGGIRTAPAWLGSTLAFVLVFAASISPGIAQEPIKKITGGKHIDHAGDEPWFGRALDGLADFNDDGVTDLLVGAPEHSYEPISDHTHSGAAYVYYGPLTDPSLSYDQFYFPKINGGYEFFGTDLAFIASFDSGGVADAIVAAPKDYRGGTPQVFQSGRVYVYYGGTSPADSPSVRLEVPASLKVAYENFGHSVADAGAFDQDAYNDIAVGAPLIAPLGTSPGKVFVFYGAASHNSTEYPDVVCMGENADDQFGFSVDAGADLTNDTFTDIVVGAPNFDTVGSSSVGKAYVLSGQTRAASLPDTLLVGSAAHATIIGENAGDQFGYAVSIIGDVNGDGLHDIAIGAPGYDDGVGSGEEGAVYVFLGGESLEDSLSASEASMRIGGEGSYFAREISAAGDLNADGFDDFIVSADNTENHQGMAYVFYGGALSANMRETVES